MFDFELISIWSCFDFCCSVIITWRDAGQVQGDCHISTIERNQGGVVATGGDTWLVFVSIQTYVNRDVESPSEMMDFLSTDSTICVQVFKGH